MRYLISVSLAYFCCICPFLGFSQNYNTDPALALQYQEAYPEAKGVILKSDHTFIFEMGNKSENEPTVREEAINRIISLKGSQTIPRYEFYNQNISLEDYRNYDDRGKKDKYQGKHCADHEIDGIFYSDAQVCAFPLKFSTRGEIQNFRVDKIYHNVRYLTSVYFHDVLPVVRKTVKVIVPEEMEIEIKSFNLEGFQISEKTYPSKNQDVQVYEFQIENLQALESYENSPGPSHTYPHILILSKSYTKEQQQHTLLASTQDLYDWYRQLVGELTCDRSVLQNKVQELTQGLEKDTDKMKAIYYWIQDHIRYIAFEDGIAAFRPDAAHEVFRKKYGDCKGMANLTKEMLKIAGLDARLTWIGTDRLVYDYSIPSLAVDNHMICTVLIGEKKYILDATEKFIGLEDYAERIQGRPVMIENGADFILYKVPTLEAERNLLEDHLALSIDGEILKGTGALSLQGENRNKMLYLLNQKQAAEHADLLAILVKGREEEARISQIEFSSTQDREVPFEISYQRESSQSIARFGDEVYVSLDPFPYLEQTKIKEERQQALDMKSKYASRTQITLNIPEAYQVKHLPENLDIQTSLFQFKIEYQLEGQKIHYTKELHVQERMIPKAEFGTWNQAIDQLTKAYEKQIILEKM